VPIEHRREDLAAAPEPPVIVLDARRDLVRLLVHDEAMSG
jgi:hypothetical protein